jgi:membrane-associated protease RseP (regulator of RpoE activity)
VTHPHVEQSVAGDGWKARWNRRVVPGSPFVPLPGDRYFGRFLYRKGAWLIVVLSVFPAVATTLLSFSGAAVLAVGYAAAVGGHELAHAMVARRFGMTINGFAVTRSGAFVRFTNEHDLYTPAELAGICVVGPLTNVAMTAAWWIIGTKVHFGDDVSWVPTLMFWANAVIAVTNLFPFIEQTDGGKVLKAWRYARRTPPRTI